MDENKKGQTPKAKTLSNTSVSQIKSNPGSDVKFWGNGDTFQLISKASSESEGWMKSTKAMEIPGVGCVIQVTTQQGGQIAEALTFAPGCRIDTVLNDAGEIVARHIVHKNHVVPSPEIG
jgi:hypothetical protein